MVASPRLGFTYLEEGETVPETALNEIASFLEAAAGHFIFQGFGTNTPPASPDQLDTYWIGSSPTGAWAGQPNKIAIRINTAWAFVTAREGMTAWTVGSGLNGYAGSAWVEPTVGAGSSTFDNTENDARLDALEVAVPALDTRIDALEAAPDGVIEDAPSDGTGYVRKDGAWSPESGGGGGGGGTDVSNLPYFGDGSDGNVTISSGTTTLTRDMYYDNLTISDTGAINIAGCKVFVKNTLDISAAPAGAIFAGNNLGGKNGSNGLNQTAGGGGNTNVASTATLGAGGTGGSSGGAGGTGAGALAGNAASPQNVIGGPAAAGGAGGAVGATTGGASRAATGANTTRDLRRLVAELVAGSVTILGGIGAPGGSAGAGDGTGSGGGGGGGGAGGGVLFLAANTINRSGATAAGAIHAKGGNGGNGGMGFGGTNRGGGGGGSGGGGGWIYLIFRTLAGSTAANCLDASGGDGGAGGNGTGTGLGGNSGGAGGGGRIDVYDLGNDIQTITGTTAAVVGNAASGSTGGSAMSSPHRANL